MKISNGISLLVLSGLIVSCVQEKVSTDVDKTFKAPGAFNSIISNNSEPDKQPKPADSEQQKPEETEQPKPLTEEEKIQKLKEDYFKQVSGKDNLNLQCNSTGCTSMYNEVDSNGKLITTTDYFVDKDSIKPFKPNTNHEFTTYTADTIVNLKNNSDNTNTNVNGKMNLNIYNETGMGEAVTNIQDPYYYGNVDIVYDGIDFTKEKFESNNVHIQHNRRLDTSSQIGKIEGSLSGDSNSNGKFNANINGDIEIDGIFTGKEKKNCNTYCDCHYCPENM